MGLWAGIIVKWQQCAHRVRPGPVACDLYVFGLIMKPIAQEIDRAVIDERDLGNGMLLMAGVRYPLVSAGGRFQEVNDLQGIGEEIETGGCAVFRKPDAIRGNGLMINQGVGLFEQLPVKTGRIDNMVVEGSLSANVDSICFDGVDQLGSPGK